MIECFRYGLIIRGLLHDNSKFLPDEFFPYAKHFYKKKDSEMFLKSFRKHASRNDHHWQYWENKGKPICMPREAMIEMICDWVAMAKTVGKDKGLKWWEDLEYFYLSKNKSMKLNPLTRLKVDEIIDEILWEAALGKD